MNSKNVGLAACSGTGLHLWIGTKCVGMSAATPTASGSKQGRGPGVARLEEGVRDDRALNFPLRKQRAKAT
jgi:hypothetical protein